MSKAATKCYTDCVCFSGYLSASCLCFVSMETRESRLTSHQSGSAIRASVGSTAPIFGPNSISSIICMYIPCIFIVYCLSFDLNQQKRARARTHAHTHTHINIYKILNYTTNSPTCFGTSAPSSGRFDIAFAEVIKY